MAARKQNTILLHIVDLGEKRVSIPVAMLGSDAEKTVLITAGMDGDEYTGIEAAYSLIDYFAKQKVSYRLIIIPIVNIPGFENQLSQNPIDGKYPKHIFPGKEKGSSTERLMYWLAENFVHDADLWIDLHSGAATEALDPFVWAWEVSQKGIQQSIVEYVQKIKADRIVFQKEKNRFVDAIAKKKTAYILLESGSLGKRDKQDVKQHIDWVKQLLDEKKQKIVKKSVYKNVYELVAEKNGIWVPLFLGKTVKKNMLLGEVRSLDGKILQKITAKESGVFLWRREAMSCAKGDDLYAFASQKGVME